MPVKNRIKPGDGDPRHGTLNGYTNHACRCEDCTAANTEAHRQYMHENLEQQAKHADRQRLAYLERRGD